MNFNEQENEAAIFEEVLSANSPEAIEIILDCRCGANLELKARILALLKSYRTSEYLERFQAAVFDTGLVGTYVGGFQVMDLIGQGGMGDVYSARRIAHPQEIVALKVIKPGMDTRQIIARFNLERDTMSRFDHPHIARFIDSGMDATGRIYFAMELIQGISIVDYCDLHRMSVEGRLHLFLDVCSAVTHAHGMGIIHRDLKPQNVLVTQQDGKAIAKVIDFGVAKALASENEANSCLTGARQWIGTPKYISPEQWTWSCDVDVRSDVYSLGVLLYELLTGSTPSAFDEFSEFDLSKLRGELLTETYDYCSLRVATYKPDIALRHAENRSTDAGRLAKTLRGDIDRITDKALQRHRDQRYATASQLADDVRAHLNGSPISLKRPSILERWQRRHPKISTSLINSVFAVAVLGVAMIVIWEIRRINHVLESVGNDLRHASFVLNMQSASQFIFSGDTVAAKKSMQEYLEGKQNPYADHFAVRLLQGLVVEASQTLSSHNDNILDMDITENRRWLASGDNGGDIILWDRQTGREVRRVHPSDNEVASVRFRPHGNLLATAGQDTVVRLWAAESLGLVGTLEKHRRTVNGLTWSPDGKLLATGDREGLVYIWDVDKQICVQELPKQLDTVRCVEWSPDGRYLAMAVKDVGVQLWETRGWNKVSEFPASKDAGALAIAFSHDSQHMVFGGYGRTLSFIDMKSLSVEHEFATPNHIRDIKIGNNMEVFVGEQSGDIQLFQRSITLDAWISTRLTNVGVKAGMQRAIVLDEEADIILTAVEGRRSIEAYPLSQLIGYRTMAMPTACIGIVSDLGVHLHSDPASTATIRDKDERIHSLNFRASSLCIPAYSKVRKQIAIASIDRGLLLLDADLLNSVAHIETEAPVASLDFSYNGERLLIAEVDGSVEVCDLRSSTNRTLGNLNVECRALGVFSPVEGFLVAGHHDQNGIVSIDERTGKIISRASLMSGLNHLCFHPKGDYLVVGEMGAFSIWTSDLSKQLWRAPLTKNGLPGAVDAICFTPEADCLAVLLRDGTVEFWDMQSKVRFFAVQTPTLSDNSTNFRRWMSFRDASTLWVSSEDGQKIFQLQAARN